jgi:hypothetical protein
MQKCAIMERYVDVRIRRNSPTNLSSVNDDDGDLHDDNVFNFHCFLFVCFFLSFFLIYFFSFLIRVSCSKRNLKTRPHNYDIQIYNI